MCNTQNHLPRMAIHRGRYNLSALAQKGLNVFLIKKPVSQPSHFAHLE